MIYLRLFFEFFKTGLFSVGGGMATLPFLHNMADATGWFTHGDVANMIAVSESTPGALGANMATYAGYITAGVPGALCATIGLVTPSVIIILIIAHMLAKFRSSPLVQHAFYGLRPASVALVAAAGIKVAQITMISPAAYQASGKLSDFVVWPAILLGIFVFVGQRKFPKIHPITFIVIAGIVGAVFGFSA